VLWVQLGVLPVAEPNLLMVVELGQSVGQVPLEPPHHGFLVLVLRLHWVIPAC
jgi:hypothetical protein